MRIIHLYAQTFSLSTRRLQTKTCFTVSSEATSCRDAYFLVKMNPVFAWNVSCHLPVVAASADSHLMKKSLKMSKG